MGDPIRILQMIGSLNVGGSQSLIVNLYNNIDRNKIQFDFILDHPQETYFKDTVIAHGAKVFEMPTFTGKNFFQVRKAWNIFFAEHPEYKILHSHVRSYASLYIPIAKKYGLKTVIHSHSTSNGEGFLSFIKGLMQYPLRYQADYLMACSNEAGEWLYGKRACKKSNYIFLPNTIDTEKYRFEEEKAAAYRAGLGLTGKTVIGHVGRFHKAKNHMFLLDVFSEVCLKRSDMMLLLVGDGTLRGDIEKRIRELGLEEHVILTGNRKDVAELMQAMDIFVFPSMWEGLPVTVVEAQAAGLPCLISDRITTDVDLSELVSRLPIGNARIWAEAILNADVKRLDVISKIKQAGFDVNDTASYLESFYCGMV